MAAVPSGVEYDLNIGPTASPHHQALPHTPKCGANAAMSSRTCVGSIPGQAHGRSDFVVFAACLAAIALESLPSPPALAGLRPTLFRVCC
jgi:hypothetical protein